VRFALALSVYGYGICEVVIRSPRPASPGSTTKVEACHPLFSCTTLAGLAGFRVVINGTRSAHGGQLSTGRSPMAYPPERAIGHQPGGGMPPWALAVAETHPRGLTGRVGAGQRPGLPRDEARFSSRRLGRNPPSGTQSLDKTPLGNRMVAWSEKNWMGSSRPVSGPFSGWGPSAGKWRPPARPRCGATC